MRIVRNIVLVISIMIVVGMVWYQIEHPRYSYRYRLTVEVEAGGQLRFGSSVIAVRQVKQVRITPEVPTVAISSSGEAVFVDLGGGRNVIAILASGQNGSDVDYPNYVVGSLFGLRGVENEVLAKYQTLRGGRDLPERLLPTFVTFGDLNEPKSGRVVAPREFEQTFGPDVHFKRAWIEITDAPTTKEIAEKVPMLKTHRSEMIQIKNDMPPRFQPHFGYFIRGM